MTSDGYCPVKNIIAHQHPKLAKITSLEEHIRPVVETNDKQRFRLELRPEAPYQQHEQQGPQKKWSIIALTSEQAAPAVPPREDAVSIELDNNCGSIQESGGSSVTKDETDEGGNAPLADEECDGLIWCIRANQGHSLNGINPEFLLEVIPSEELASLSTIVHGSYFDAWRKIQESGGLSKMNRTHIHCASGLLLSKKGSDGEKVISGMRASSQVYIYIDGSKCAKDDIRFFRSDNGVLLTAGVNESGMLPLEYLSHVTDNKGNVLLDNRSKQ